MAGLAETVSRLAALRRERASPAAAGGTGAKMTAVGDFGPNPGALRMLSYTPETLAPGAALVVVLHGCTQGAEAHATQAGWLSLAERHGFAVIAPEQTSGNNPNRCFNWFEPGDTGRGLGEAASIAAMTAQRLAQGDLDPARVFVTGLSAGGAMAAVMLATYPEVFAGGAVIAGLPYGAARNVQGALSLMRGSSAPSAEALGALVRGAAPAGGALPRLTVWHGDADHTVSARNGRDVAEQWAAAQGLMQADTVETLARHVRTTWRTPDGETAVEHNLVRGLGHGTPLATGGEAGVGAAGPFMLEAGVSSTLEAARFWGLTDTAPTARKAARPTAPRTETAPSPSPALAPKPAPAPEPAGIGETVIAGLSGHIPPQVEAVIQKALKSAGLLR